MDLKTEVQGIYKSEEGVLVNKDNDALSSYKRRKLKTQQINTVTEDVAALKHDIQEIKTLLQRIITNGTS